MTINEAGSPPERTKILLALERAEHPMPTVLDALRLAQRLGAELEVVRIVPEVPRRTAFRPFMAADVDLERRQRLHEQTKRWLSMELGEAARLARVVVAQGDFVDRVALRCRGRAVQLVVVSSEVQRSGSLVRSLAHVAQVPVLASSGLDHQKPILAATDLQDPNLPVLWQAARLAAHLRTSLVAFHNVDPMFRQRRPIAIPDAVLTGGGPSAGARRARLVEAGQLLPVAAVPVVRSQTDSAHAILTEARALDVGMIVVGTRCHSWLARLFGFSVAGEVTSRANCPVMVTPIGEAPATAA